MGAAVASAVSAGVSGVGAILSGILQTSKANRLEKRTVRPTYTVPTQVGQNVNISKTMAQSGLPDEQYNNAVSGINRNQASAFNAIRGNTNGLLGVNNIVTASNDAVNNLNVADGQAKIRNINTYMNQNQNAADYTDKAFQYNKADKYAEVAAKIAQLRRGGNTSLFNGINGASQIAGSYLNSKED
jgi:hypothetical protein